MTAAVSYRVVGTIEKPFKEIEDGGWIKVTTKGGNAHVVKAERRDKASPRKEVANIVLNLAEKFFDAVYMNELGSLFTEKNDEDANTSSVKLRFCLIHIASRGLGFEG